MQQETYEKQLIAADVFEDAVKKRLPSESAGLLSASLKPMDTGTTTNTTRKRFLKRAGLALAASCAMGATVLTKSTPKQTSTLGNTPSAMSRIRPAKGTVARHSVDLV